MAKSHSKTNSTVPPSASRNAKSNGKPDARMRSRNSTLILLLLVVLAGTVARMELFRHSPHSLGYAYDNAWEPVRVSAEKGRLARAGDCWQCYHPPLYPLLGLATHRLLSDPGDTSMETARRSFQALSLLWNALTFCYVWALARLFQIRGAGLVLTLATLLFLPRFFFISAAISVDALLMLLLTAFLYHLIRFLWNPTGGRACLHLSLAGIWGGLACSTKFNGLLVLPVLLGAVAWHGLRSRVQRKRVLSGGLLALLLIVMLGGYRYLDNMLQFGEPLRGNQSAQQGFSLEGPSYGREYELHTFRLNEILQHQFKKKHSRSLTRLDFYGSVPTTLYGLFWGDLGFFSREGLSVHIPFPPRKVNPWLTSAIYVLGLLPTALVFLGLFYSMAARESRSRFFVVHLFALTGLAAYLWWALRFPVDEWAIKAKYLLFLVGPLALYFAAGLEVLESRITAVRAPIRVLLTILLILCLIYQFQFARG